LADTSDAGAMLYLGHLAAQAEIALPGAGYERHAAMTWISAHIAAEKSRLWTATLEDITVDGISIGTWSIRARTRLESPTPVTWERRATLIRDGTELTELARTLLTGKVAERGVKPLLDISMMILASKCHPEGRKIEIRDLDGLHVTAKISKKSNPLMLLKNSYLKIRGL